MVFRPEIRNLPPPPENSGKERKQKLSPLVTYDFLENQTGSFLMFPCRNR